MRAPRRFRISYPFVPGNTPTGIVMRPFIPVRLTGPRQSARYLAMADSGADRSVIPLSTADFLGLRFDGKPPRHVRGIGGEVAVASARVDATVGRGTRMFTFRRLSVDVPTRRVPGLIPILGREDIFERFEVSFDIRRDAITLRLSR